MYDDDYPTCRATYATLRIFHEDLSPQEVSSMLSLSPSDAHRKGDLLHSVPAGMGGWFLSSKGKLESRDVRRHVVWILDQLEPNKDALFRLQDSGYETNIFCYWISANGHGGPDLDRDFMERLVSLRLDLGFDIYL